MDQALRARYESGIVQALKAGQVTVPGVLLKYYKRLNLTEVDVMVLLHLHYCREQEHNDFPTWEHLAERMAATAEQIASSLQRMLKQRLLTIDEEVDPHSGVRSERYNWSLLYHKLAEAMEPEEAGNARQAASSASASPPATGEATLFSAFEHEFGRPLSPMECETISAWLDQDRYAEELILLALKEAVFAGKVHFKYIDRILLEWSRNRVTNAQQAKAYAQRFRGR